MIKIIGLTGGIGSGKSTVASFFKELGVPVYIADDAAKIILEQQETVELIKQTFENVVNGTKIDRKKLAAVVFGNEDNLKQLNAIIHPAVKRHFEEWIKVQRYPFAIKEAAILFESGTYKNCDQIITVTAPLEDRISRVMQRDNANREQILARIQHQWTDEKRIENSNYVISNTNLDLTKKQVLRIYTELFNLYSAN